MRVFGRSDIGLKRKSNQDCFYSAKVNESALWAVVCDGMGGVNGGDVASNLAVKSIKESLSNGTWEELGEIQNSDVKKMLKNALKKANLEIFTNAQDDKNLAGMGTTAVLVAVVNDKIHVAHVGDSRAYLVRQGKINQLTIDHSMVQEMIDEGEITHEEAKMHPNKNIITRALGISKDVDVDYSMKTKKPGDAVIICTDGLTNYLDQKEILDYFKVEKGEAFVDGLISAANERGGADNITVVALCE